MKLCEQSYHFKQMDDFFCVYDDDLKKSVGHMLLVLQRVMSVPAAREYVVAPITIRTWDTLARRGGDAFVFRNLVGFRIGLPADEAQRGRYLDALRRAVDAIHDAGVVHLDLYPSNVMWKEDEGGSVDVKIVDWDAAHFLNEALTPKALQRMNSSELYECRVLAGLFEDGGATATMAIKEFDSCFVDLLSRVAADEQLHTTEKKALDVAFKAACVREARRLEMERRERGRRSS